MHAAPRGLALQAVMVVADSRQSLTITGNGDVLEPHDGIIGELVAVAACTVHTGCCSSALQLSC